MSSELVEVGYVARAHGITGDVRIVLHNPDSTVLDTAGRLHVAGRVFDVERWRAAGKGYLVRLHGVSDREAADAMRGQPVFAARGDLGLEDDEVLLADFVGCEAVLADGTSWGRVVDVQLGPQELLVVHGDGVERLVPLVPEFVAEIDLDDKRVTLTPPEGLPEQPL